MSAPTAARPHGRAKYVVERCRCHTCRTANTAYQAQRSRQRLYKQAAYVDAGPVRAHVEALMAAGLGRRRVAELAGVPSGTLSKLLYGDQQRGLAPSKRVRPVTAARLLAVQAAPNLIADGRPVDATGTRRRLQALVANGWSQAKLAERLGVLRSNFSPLISGERVQAGTARAVADLYEQLWDTPPPETTHRDKIAASRARRHAAGQGWARPMAWDDDTIDDPTATDAADPEVADAVADPVAVELACTGRLRAAQLSEPDLAAAVRELEAQDLSVGGIARRLMTTKTKIAAVLAVGCTQPKS